MTLPQDNANFRIAQFAVAEGNTSNFELLDQHTYTLDLALSNLFLYSKLKH